MATFDSDADPDLGAAPAVHVIDAEVMVERSSLGTSRPRDASSLGPAPLTHDERSEQTATLFAEAAAADDPELVRQLHGRIVLLNRRVAQAVASRFSRRSVSDDDLEQAACEGLVKAVARFDPARGLDFLTYAVPTIRGEVQRHLRDHGGLLRAPRRLQEQRTVVNRATDDLLADLGREPTTAELHDRTGLDAGEQAQVAADLTHLQTVSLDQPLRSYDDLTMGDTVVEAPDDLDAAETRAELLPALKRLTARDRRIVFLRFFEDRTQQEIGHDLGVTQMQVARLLGRILRDLRREVGPRDVRRVEPGS